jgi:hypothetical protein
MPGKRVQFDNETWEAIVAARSEGSSFHQLTDEAFADLLKKHKQPVGLMASLGESIGKPRAPKRAGANTKSRARNRWRLSARLSGGPAPQAGLCRERHRA